ncbi:Histone acetyltransferase KAT7 [Toxocara canis]|uniref:Histone acetyltransferase n=1 Tax=Toxocara canis TaxID=6265 RepID=A0A0B2V2F5_TOXCA|nr:Histone acetyltransferase KAT7 [Toxocara canis]
MNLARKKKHPGVASRKHSNKSHKRRSVMPTVPVPKLKSKRKHVECEQQQEILERRVTRSSRRSEEMPTEFQSTNKTVIENGKGPIRNETKYKDGSGKYVEMEKKRNQKRSEMGASSSQNGKCRQGKKDDVIKKDGKGPAMLFVEAKENLRREVGEKSEDVLANKENMREQWVHYANHEMKAVNESPFPKVIASSPHLYICHFCLKTDTTRDRYDVHMEVCSWLDLGYKISLRERKVGGPEHPLSDLGLLTYRSYWKAAIISYIRKNRGRSSISLKEVSYETGIHTKDVVSTLTLYSLLLLINDVYYIDVKKVLRLPLSSFRHRVMHDSRLKWKPSFEVDNDPSKMGAYND